MKPGPHQRKGDLSTRGWVGCLLGRSLSSVGAVDVWVPSIGRVVSSSSALVDEEYFPWRDKDAHVPLPSATKSGAHVQPAPLAALN